MINLPDIRWWYSQCDELRPRCSRCSKRMYNCEYESPRGRSRLHFQPAFSDDHLSLGSSSPHSASSNTLLPYSPSVNENCEILSMNSDSPSTLDATELDLFSHYLTHTSRNIPFDDLDHYALSVGIPNIAFKSRPVMSSLIALAAACKCHDLVKPNTSLEGRTVMEVQELLLLAERHHRSSLQHIQVAMAHSDCYDNILANAALMVLYASASHSVRVHLATSAKAKWPENAKSTASTTLTVDLIYSRSSYGIHRNTRWNTWECDQHFNKYKYSKPEHQHTRITEPKFKWHHCLVAARWSNRKDKAPISSLSRFYI